MSAPHQDRIGPFRIVGSLPPSAIGRCHLGVRDGGDPVEVVLTHPAAAADPAFRERLRAAVRAARDLGHPALATVVAADPDAELPWLAFDLVPAVTLDRAVADIGPLPAGTVRTVASGIAAGLAVWHAAGLVHGGLEPARVRLTRSGPVLHGAVAAAARPRPGLDGVATRSPGYLSPEQAEGHDPGPASDVFSLASVVTFAATGRAPFGDHDAEPAGPTALGVLRRIRQGRADEVQRILDGRTRVVVEDSMRRPPGERPDAATARDRYAAGQPATPLPAEIAALLPGTPAAAGAPPVVGQAVSQPAPGRPGATYPDLPHPTGPYPGAPQPGTPHPGAPYPTGPFPAVAPPVPGPVPAFGPPGSPVRPPRRVARRALIGGAAVLVVAGAVGGGLWAGRDRVPPAPTQRWRLPGPGGERLVYLAGGPGIAVIGGPGPTVRAVDAVTGQSRWSRSLSGPTGGFPSSGADAVYITDAGELRCLDATTGAPRWSSRYTTLLAVDGEIAVVDRIAEPPSDTLSELVGLRTTNGALVWRIPTDESPDRSPSVGGDGRAHLVIDEEVVTVETASGRVLWRARIPGGPYDLRLCAGIVFVTTAGSPEVTALDAVTGTRRWAGPPGGQDRGGAPELGTDGSVLVANTGRDLTAVDPQTGGPVWTNGAAPGQGVSYLYLSGSPTVTGGHVFVPGIRSDPASDARGAAHLFAFDPADGTELWAVPVPQYISSVGSTVPILVGDTVVLSTRDGAVYGFGPVQ